MRAVISQLCERNMRSLECRFDSKVALVLVAAHPPGALKPIVTKMIANARNAKRVALPVAAMRIPFAFFEWDEPS